MSTQKVWVVTETTGEYDEVSTEVIAVAATEERAREVELERRKLARVAAVGNAYLEWKSFNLARREYPSAYAHVTTVYGQRGLNVNDFFAFKRDEFSLDQFDIYIQEETVLS